MAVPRSTALVQDGSQLLAASFEDLYLKPWTRYQHVAAFFLFWNHLDPWLHVPRPLKGSRIRAPPQKVAYRYIVYGLR